MEDWVWGVTLTALHALVDAPVHKTGVELSVPGANVLRDIIIRAEQSLTATTGLSLSKQIYLLPGDPLISDQWADVFDF